MTYVCIINKVYMYNYVQHWDHVCNWLCKVMANLKFAQKDTSTSVTGRPCQMIFMTILLYYIIQIIQLRQRWGPFPYLHSWGCSTGFTVIPGQLCVLWSIMPQAILPYYVKIKLYVPYKGL